MHIVAADRRASAGPAERIRYPERLAFQAAAVVGGILPFLGLEIPLAPEGPAGIERLPEEEVQEETGQRHGGHQDRPEDEGLRVVALGVHRGDDEEHVEHRDDQNPFHGNRLSEGGTDVKSLLADSRVSLFVHKFHRISLNQ